MPWKPTVNGNICPIEKFVIRNEEGVYTKDPLECCLSCNFYSPMGETLEKCCQCPTDMSYDEYDELRIWYTFEEKKEGKLTKKGFQEFVAKVRNLKQVK